MQDIDKYIGKIHPTQKPVGLFTKVDKIRRDLKRGVDKWIDENHKYIMG